MKKVEAIVRPHLLDAVRTALQELEVVGMTISEVQGYGRQKGFTELYRGAEYAATLLPKIKIEVAVPSELVDKTVEAIAKSANTGHIGWKDLCHGSRQRGAHPNGGDERCSTVGSNEPLYSSREWER